MQQDELVVKLREYAEWAEANNYHAPDGLADILYEAADFIDEM